MKAYLDSSVILRRFLGESGALDGFERLSLGVTSQITKLECVRTLDRLHLRGLIMPEELVKLRHDCLKLMTRLEVVQITGGILALAESSFSVPVGSLDALHLASAVLWNRKHQQPLDFWTHDHELALAATAQGFAIRGVD